MIEWLASEASMAWARVQPPLGGVDLRPYLFVTKDRKDYFGAVSALAFTQMALLIGLGLTAFLALTFLASALMRSAVAAGGVGFAAWLALALLGVSSQLLPYTPNGLNDPAQALALGATPQHLAQPIIATIALIVVALALTQIAFARQEPAPPQG